MSKIINGRETYLEEVRFSTEDLYSPEDQENFSEEGSLDIIDDSITTELPPQEAYSISSYRVRLNEMRRPIFIRMKRNMRDCKSLMEGGSMESEELARLKRLFTDDITSLIQEASEIARAGGRTIDLVLRLNSLGIPELNRTGREFGMTMRKVNRIRDRMKFIPKRQQEELNASLTKLVAVIVDNTFGTTNVKTYKGFMKDEEK